MTCRGLLGNSGDSTDVLYRRSVSNPDDEARPASDSSAHLVVQISHPPEQTPRSGWSTPNLMDLPVPLD